jgi:hypothetical protein
LLTEPVKYSPTAKQLVILEHSTPPRSLFAAPTGLGLATIAQVVPFHCSTNVEPSPLEPALKPTAKQLVVSTHDTPNSADSVALLGLGLATIAQVVPFQRSTNVFSTEFDLSPTAKQLVVSTHDTPPSPALVEPSVGLGLPTIDQLVPFQRSTNVCIAEVVEKKPTAKQLDVLGHDTPSRAEPVAPPGFGLATIDQLVPSQRSTNVFWPGPLAAPTAKQLVVLAHDTPFSSDSFSPVGFGLATTDQLVPFQWSTSVARPPPTAKQLVVLGHDMLPKEPFGGPNGFGLATTDHAGVALAGTAAAPIAPAARPTETTSRARTDRPERHEHNNGLAS